MCGRFTLRTGTREIAKLFDDLTPQLEIPPIMPRYNIAPTQSVLAIRQPSSDAAPQCVMLRWGLVPFWAKDKKIASRLINARAESVAEKPAFKHALARNRCLIVADGFYEWISTEHGKQPVHLSLDNDDPFCFAGLWQLNDKLGEPMESCTIVTTSANATASQFHDRMPVIVMPEDFAAWLDPDLQSPNAVLPLLKPLMKREMKSRLVSRRVNKASYDAADCLDAA